MIPYLVFATQCLIGAGVFAAIWRLPGGTTIGRLRSPASAEGPITLDSDYRGLV